MDTNWQVLIIEDDELDRALESWQLAGLLAASRLDSGAIELARILARARPHDGHWPAVAVRRLLAESPPEARLSERLRMAKRNLRGMTSRAVGEGGRQERGLAERYRASAIALRSAWPATAMMLERLAQEYAFDAAEQDDGARAIRRREGLDIPETSDELPSDRSQAAPLSSNETNADD